MTTATAYFGVNMETAVAWDGTVTIADSTHIQVTEGARLQNYYGSFTYSSTDLTGGTVTSTNYYTAGSKIYEITGGSYSALTIESYVDAGNLPGLFGYVFGGNDTFNGSSQADTLNGYGGNDNMLGNGGNDVLKGGAGTDTMNGGTGADTMFGGSGNDTYYVDN